MACEIVVCISANDSLAYNYIMPIALHPEVSKVWIVRPGKSLYGEIPKSEYVLAPARFRILRFIQMLYICLKLGARKEVRAFASFNPFPYGFIACIAAIRHRKPIHFGFIGSDWYRHIKAGYGKILLPLVKLASFITATGDKMREEMLQRGLNSEKIRVLPHCINLDRVRENDPEHSKYTCIYTGQLIERKRVDLILRGFAKASGTHPQAKLCIVGDGILREKIESMAHRLGIADSVTFTGYINDVQPYLTDSMIIIIASDMEGFPFSLVEGICSGLVPVSTMAGTIPNLIKDSENGLNFPYGDSDSLADCINKLMDDRDLYIRLRNNALKLKRSFSYENATDVWDKWLRKIKYER
jgi:glycosyltransferase involved in cell wall biosynthesis